MVNSLSSKLVGGVFIIAAILKLISIDEFEIYIYSFNIFSFLLTTFVSRIIIIGEFILGLFLKKLDAIEQEKEMFLGGELNEEEL